MRFSMLYSGEQILSFKSCLVFYAGDSLTNKNLAKKFFPYGVPGNANFECFHCNKQYQKSKGNRPKINITPCMGKIIIS